MVTSSTDPRVSCVTGLKKVMSSISSPKKETRTASFE